jgi:hypothetical protein
MRAEVRASAHPFLFSEGGDGFNPTPLNRNASWLRKELSEALY